MSSSYKSIQNSMKTELLWFSHHTSKHSPVWRYVITNKAAQQRGRKGHSGILLVRFSVPQAFPFLLLLAFNYFLSIYLFFVFPFGVFPSAAVLSALFQLPFIFGILYAPVESSLFVLPPFYLSLRLFSCSHSLCVSSFIWTLCTNKMASKLR